MPIGHMVAIYIGNQALEMKTCNRNCDKFLSYSKAPNICLFALLASTSKEKTRALPGLRIMGCLRSGTDIARQYNEWGMANIG